MHEGYSMETCEQCGKRFMSDSGDQFCSNSCERQFESDHAECKHCREQVGESHLSFRGLCESCEEELENE
jgi:hypothetical protein